MQSWARERLRSMFLEILIITRTQETLITIQQLHVRINITCRKVLEKFFILNIEAVSRVYMRYEVSADKVFMFAPEASISLIFHTVPQELVELRFILDISLALELVTPPRSDFRRSFLLQ